jgi:hypothetical protein
MVLGLTCKTSATSLADIRDRRLPMVEIKLSPELTSMLAIYEQIITYNRLSKARRIYHLSDEANHRILAVYDSTLLYEPSKKLEWIDLEHLG